MVKVWKLHYEKRGYLSFSSSAIADCRGSLVASTEKSLVAGAGTKKRPETMYVKK